MHVDGSCYCRANRFVAEIEPKRVGICHCTDCQIFSSSAFRTRVLMMGEDFELLAGTPAVFEKTAESGARRQLWFCSSCGTHLYGSTVREERILYSVRVGCLAQRAELAPVAQVWCRSELPWISSLRELRRVETQ